ncbi:MAG: HAD hydrolase-like protein [Gammaproteobacteria bacterium]
MHNRNHPCPLAERRCWVFDLDGTLTVAQHNFDDIRSALGIPPGHLILEYLDSLPARQAAPLRGRLDDIEAALSTAARPAPGARELLTMLRASGARLGILTRNTRDNALAALGAAGLADFFAAEAVLGRGEAAPKPSADGIKQLLAAWNGASDDGLMIGDVHLDLAAGRAAGVLTVHVSAGSHRRWPELTDHHLLSLSQLYDVLQGHNLKAAYARGR